MIAAVKGRYAAWAALLVLCPLRARAADDSASAVRELAAKSAGFAGAGATLALTWRNTSSLGSAEAGQARAAFEAALRQFGQRIAENPAVELRLTVSENPTQYLLVAEARRGDERQVWIAAWPKRESAARHGAPGVALDRHLVWEQEEQILDVAFPAARMLVLSPSKVTVYNKSGGPWEFLQSLPIATAKPWPRDLRGRLRTAGSTFQVFLPGMTCNGTVDPAPVMECHPSEEPWVLESGSRGLLLANFLAGRNYFDGRVVAQNGAPRTVAPFYTAASVEERGQTFWLLALVDGRAQIFDSSLAPLAGAAIAAWGSDIAGIDARCGPPSQVLVTRPGDGTEPDAIQGFSIADQTPQTITAPVIFPGPVTALWSFGGNSALAVARDLSTGTYSAYVVTVACGS
ncbi:MAG TPA: hypothetical protein VKB88_10370 [Bryobacteraceae bacterium]|nr:hypothetical protein [Bryobacteraceae bacterium]